MKPKHIKHLECTFFTHTWKTMSYADSDLMDYKTTLSQHSTPGLHQILTGYVSMYVSEKDFPSYWKKLLAKNIFIGSSPEEKKYQGNKRKMTTDKNKRWVLKCSFEYLGQLCKS